MDASIQKTLHDKNYEKRKAAAIELEDVIRTALAAGNKAKIQKIIDQLCHDFTYNTHQTNARTGGLIGLAGASIALGQDVGLYMDEIVPPILACFSDQDARVRYYACESLYNIAKSCKGEILPYFNEIFDALAKLSADTEISVKNGAELLDRLVKDIISDSAASYVSIVHRPEEAIESDSEDFGKTEAHVDRPTAFSLPRFIPLLRERIQVNNAFTRQFLVSWITLLDSVPDLELITYLPSFLGGLFKFLNDSNQDVLTSTQHILERLLQEIRNVARVKREIAIRDETKKMNAANARLKSSVPVDSQSGNVDDAGPKSDGTKEEAAQEHPESGVPSETSSVSKSTEEDWIPGQDIHVDHPKILEIVVNFLGNPSENVQLTALRWIDSFFDICPEHILPFVPRLLSQVLPALSSDVDQIRKAGGRVNSSLIDYILSLPDDEDQSLGLGSAAEKAPSLQNHVTKEQSSQKEQKSAPATAQQTTGSQGSPTDPQTPSPAASPDLSAHEDGHPLLPGPIDYEACVNALTSQFLNKSEATRAATLSWLIMLQTKAPKKVVAAHDNTFPALLKTLSDTSDTVVTRDLQLLCQISRKSDESYFSFFIVNLLKLFSADRKLLEARGNLIVRQLCVNLSPERILRSMADCLEKEGDPDFASVMVQNLNNNLLTAPELADLRRKLRNWDNKDGPALFMTLFKAWCQNAIATVSLCLLAQAYEQAYNILQIFADVEMNVTMLTQIDKLVQLLESPVFTYLRLQLLEVERYPYLYKCLYGILMLLPQSAAFAALKNRLNSVSAIGYLHIPSAARTNPSTPVVAAIERPNRLRSREEGQVRWPELIERFKNAQDKSRARERGEPFPFLDVEPSRKQSTLGAGPGLAAVDGSSNPNDRRHLATPDPNLRRMQTSPGVESGRPGVPSSSAAVGATQAAPAPADRDKEHAHKSRFGASHFQKFTSGVKGKNKKSG